MKKNGFTLIELLVVISIVGLISTLGVVSLQKAQRAGRDAKRIGDIKQLGKTLALYYDSHGNYPSTSEATCVTSLGSCSGCSSSPCSGSDWDTNSALYQAIVVNDGLMSKLPKDPVNGGSSPGRFIRYVQKNFNDGQNCYILLGGYETKNVPKCHDLNGDGVLTTSDWTWFANHSGAEGSARYNGMIDYNSDGSVNSTDYNNYLAPLLQSAADARISCWVCDGG